MIGGVKSLQSWLFGGRVMMDATQAFNVLLDFAGSVALGLAGLAVTRVTSYIQTWFQKRNVQDAVNTAAGGVMLQLASGALTVAQVSTSHPTVTALATSAFDRVATSANALGGVTPQSIAQLVVGAVGHALAGDPTVPTVAGSPLSQTTAALARLVVPQGPVTPVAP